LDNRKVRPIGIRVQRPILNVNNANSGIKTELALFLFLPYTHFRVKFLGVEDWSVGVVGCRIGESLGLPLTPYKSSDKSELIKKLNFRPPSLASLARLVQAQLHPIILSPESVLAALEKSGRNVPRAVEELRKSITEPNFRKNPNDRMINFQERKRIMIRNARIKYCKEHGIEY